MPQNTRPVAIDLIEAAARIL